jgi:cobalamin biosynthesis protein CbiD
MNYLKNFLLGGISVLVTTGIQAQSEDPLKPN